MYLTSAQRPRRVLITGGMGFVGGHLSRALLEAGDHVTVIDNLSTGNERNVAELRNYERFRAVTTDVENSIVLDRLVSESTLIIHLAAAVGVELIVSDPIRTITTNIHGTSAVLEAADRYKVHTLIASTSEVYGKSTQLPFREDGDVVLGPTSKNRWSYAASKMVDEFLGLAYVEHSGLPVTLFRLFNTVGPRQTGQYGMVVPRFVQAALEGRPIPVYGDGQQSRCFLHVSDAVDAIMRLIDTPEAVGKVCNVGSTELVTIQQLAERVLSRVDKWRGEESSTPTSDRLTFIPYDEAYQSGFEDMRTRRPDTSRLNQLTGWVPTKTLDNILDDVIADLADLHALGMSRIVVTGGAGFIGSHTTVELLDAGHDVVIIDNFDNSSPKALDAITRLAGRRPRFAEGDVADTALLDEIFGERPVDSVIHFAGLKAVGESVADPMKYYRTNIGTSIALVDAMVRHDVDRLVFSSSCTVYGEPEVVPITEDAPLQAVNPYGRTKLLIEDMLRDVAVAHPAMRIALLRYFNPVGAHPSGELGEDPQGIPNNLMPYIMQVAVGRLAVLPVFGGDYPTPDGTCIRDFIHVVDLARGHLAALESLERLGAGCRHYNLGTGRPTTVLEMIEAARRASGRPIPYEIRPRRAGDAMSVYADPTYANAELGWKAELTVDDMCRDHWSWQASHPYGFAS